MRSEKEFQSTPRYPHCLRVSLSPRVIVGDDPSPRATIGRYYACLSRIKARNQRAPDSSITRPISQSRAKVLQRGFIPCDGLSVGLDGCLCVARGREKRFFFLFRDSFVFQLSFFGRYFCIEKHFTLR